MEAVRGPAPNEYWQIDAMDWVIATGPVKIFNTIDDHSRLLIRSRAVHEASEGGRSTGPDSSSMHSTSWASKANPSNETHSRQQNRSSDRHGSEAHRTKTQQSGDAVYPTSDNDEDKGVRHPIHRELAKCAQCQPPVGPTSQDHHSEQRRNDDQRREAAKESVL